MTDSLAGLGVLIHDPQLLDFLMRHFLDVRD